MPMTAPILTLQLLQQQKDALPLAQRQVIDVILRDPGAAVLATVEQLAAQAGVSMPTIVRMCRRFGFDSVREFMVALAQTLAVSGSLSTKDNMTLFQKQIGMAGNSVIGVYIPDDADITGADPDMWRDIAMNLIGENMMILDATQAKVATALYMQKQESKISAYLKTDVIVSGDLGPAALQKALADAVPIIMHEQEAIVVMTHPTVLAVQTLSDWVKTLPAKGIRLVPATKFTGLKG